MRLTARSTATAWSPSMPSGASLKRCTDRYDMIREWPRLCSSHSDMLLHFCNYLMSRFRQLMYFSVVLCSVVQHST